MKLINTLLVVTLFCGGCSFSRGSRTTKDGTTYTVTSWNFLLNREGVKFETKDTNGFTAALEIKKQNPDAETLEAAMRGGAEGLAKGMK